jgi:hypothetical protein
LSASLLLLAIEKLTGYSADCLLSGRPQHVKNQQQLELFAVLIFPCQARVSAALFQSLHQMEMAEKRWSRY